MTRYNEMLTEFEEFKENFEYCLDHDELIKSMLTDIKQLKKEIEVLKNNNGQ